MVAVYAVLACIGAVGTWYFNVLSITAGDPYLADWFTNPASSSAAVNVLVVALVVCLFVVAEGRRLGMPHAWLLVPLTFLVAVAFTFPAFLAWREHHLARTARLHRDAVPA